MAVIEVRPVRPHECAQAGAVIVAAYRAIPDSGAVLADGYAGELADVAARANGAEVLVAVEAESGQHATVVGCVTLVTDQSSPWAEMLGGARRDVVQFITPSVINRASSPRPRL